MFSASHATLTSSEESPKQNFDIPIDVSRISHPTCIFRPPVRSLNWRHMGQRSATTARVNEQVFSKTSFDPQGTLAIGSPRLASRSSINFFHSQNRNLVNSSSTKIIVGPSQPWRLYLWSPQGLFFRSTRSSSPNFLFSYFSYFSFQTWRKCFSIRAEFLWGWLDGNTSPSRSLSLVCEKQEKLIHSLIQSKLVWNHCGPRTSWKSFSPSSPTLRKCLQAPFWLLFKSFGKHNRFGGAPRNTVASLIKEISCLRERTGRGSHDFDISILRYDDVLWRPK